jgi:hypothetical protein
MDAWPDETPPLSALRDNAARLWHAGRPEEAAHHYAELAERSSKPFQALL